MRRDISKRIHHVTPEEDRVSFWQKLAYGAGSVASSFMGNGVMQLSQVVYNVGLGVNPALVAIAQSAPRFWEAVTDPFMGSISDNCRSRFGRRKPFIALGAILTGVFFAIVFGVPRGWSQYGYFYYFLITSALYYTAYTIFFVPFSALGYEMTRDYHEKTRIQSFAQGLSNIMGFFFPWFFALAKMDVFRDVVEGGRYLGLGLGLMMLLLGLVPAVFVKEKYAEQVINQEKVPLVKGIRETFRNRPFVQLISSVTVMMLGVFSIQITGLYLTIYYVCGGNQKVASVVQGYVGTAFNVGNLLGIPFVTLLSSKFGKKQTLIGFMFASLLAAVLKWFCYSPHYPYLAIIPNLLFGMSCVALWILAGSMIADLCDVDELHTGDRREGMYGAVYSWMLKFGVSLALLSSGWILNSTGFNASLGQQSTSTVLWMRIMFSAASGCASLASIVLLWAYPVTEERVYEIRAKLDARRKEVAALPETDSPLAR